MAVTEGCPRAGCEGRIEDGFCTECGFAPPTTASPSRPASSTPSTPSTPTSSRARRPSGLSRSVLPAMPPSDPLAVLVPGEVPSRRRRCSSCGTELRLTSGFCPQCQRQYSFEPTLEAGRTVAGKYDVKGTIAFGGQGWIYLAKDSMLDRWVVLKGLVNSHDPALQQAAAQERLFLAAMNHPNVVSIYDFIVVGPDGFIVMEYVDGKSLFQLRRERGGPLPPREACGYVLELLPAFAYLHDQGLLYCDFKIDNAIVGGDTVKLIDMGAVRRAGQTGGHVYGTRGYSAPEAEDQPSPTADLYTVARALAILVADFDFRGSKAYRLPDPDESPALQQHRSLLRFLLKATRDDPACRFQSADEMAGQLQGVLRDITAGQGVLAPVVSALFEDETGRDVAVGPAGESEGSDSPMRSRRLPALRQAASGDPGDWRAAWDHGQAALRAGDGPRAIEAFDLVLDEVPGELAPKLALAYASEQAGEVGAAAELFELVSLADPSSTSAALGLARCRRVQGDREGAVRALERVPETSSQYDSARLAIAQALTDDTPNAPGPEDVRRAEAVVRELLAGGRATIAVHRVAARILAAAAAQASTADGWSGLDGAALFLGVAVAPDSLRLGAARELLECARLAATRAERIRYVEEANRSRPFTWV